MNLILSFLCYLCRNLCTDNGDAARKWVVADPITVATVINLLTAVSDDHHQENYSIIFVTWL